MNARRSRLLGAVALVATAGLWSSADAQAGYIIQPADGATTTPQPTFLVGLDSQDSGATVYVSTSPAMSSSGSPNALTGSCTPATPFGEPDKYTCTPSSYAPGSTPSLSPGTYYWWMTYSRLEPGRTVSELRISGPFRFVVAAPTRPANAGLVSPSDGATVRHPVRLSARVPAGATVSFHASTSDARRGDGSPVGTDYAGCSRTVETAGTHSCALDDTAIEGRTYFWWAIVTVDGTPWVYGPRRVTLASRSRSPSAPASSATYRTAEILPTLRRFTGERSIKHQALTDVIYKTMKALGAPRTLAFACWTESAYESVFASATGGGHPDQGSTYALAFWHSRQPRWLHLSSRVCERVQNVLDRKAPTGSNAFGLMAALHEAMHAYGIGNEARANCYAVQLVPLAASYAGSTRTRANYLGTLAVRYTRRTAPAGYWDRAQCRDGGAWDLFPGATNLG